MSVFVNHPDGWIGVPDRWPFDRWAEPAAWARHLVEELVATGQVAAGDAGAHVEVAAFVASTQAERGASRSFLAFAQDDVFLADLVVEPRSEFDVRSLAELAGADDRQSVERPLVQPFDSDDGVTGARCIRYLDVDDGTSSLIARADYVYVAGEALARIYSATYDQVQFERMLPALDALARTVAFR